MQVEMLRSKGIPEELWNKCYISGNNVYLPNDLKTAEEVYQDTQKQIDNCTGKQPKSNKELTKENDELWETVEFLLKQVDLIPKGDCK